MESENKENSFLVQNDTEWITDTYYVISCNSQNNHGMLRMANGRVTCDGSKGNDGTIFKLYQGSPRDSNSFDRLILFECIGGDNHGYMLCIDNKTKALSCRKRSREYTRITDVTKDPKEHDAVFQQLVPDKESTKFLLRSLYDEKCYIGANVDGTMCIPVTVDPLSAEAAFLRAPSN